MDRIKWGITAFASAFCFHSFAQDTGPGKKPNVLILLADDLGYGELGAYGQQVIRTPNLDALAEKGLRFTNFYAGCAVCSPSRAVLMTGIQVGRLSIRGNKGLLEDGSWDRVALKKSEMTLAEMLRGAGYQTAFIGKWHLGIPTDLSTWAYNRGFDYAVQEQWGPKPEGGIFDERVHWVNNRDGSVFYDYTKYSCLDEFRTDLALKFLDEQRDLAKPLFLFMSYRTPHAHEYHLRETDLYSDRGWPENERLHAARITMLDAQIQRLLDKLDETGELDHTLILFASDNGPTKEGVDPAFFSASGEFRGCKRDVYEGGIRIPFIAVWNGKIPAGRTSDYPGIFYDIMPTLAELAGTPAPGQTDGISILPELLGKKQPEHPPLYWEIQLVSGKAGDFRQAARLGPWKVVRYGSGGAPQLYNLDRDPRETKNVAAGYPEILQKMSTVLKTNSQKSPNYPYAGRDF